MLEIIVERWTGLGGGTAYLWSLWRDGQRLETGPVQASPEHAEAEAKFYCLTHLGQAPDKTTRL